MIDTLMRMLPKAEMCLPGELPQRYALVTLHRPSNVDDVDSLRRLIQVLKQVSHDLAVIFPLHPRTRQKMRDAGLPVNGDNRSLRFCEPAPYLEFLALQRRAAVVITDSGGIQEESTFLGVPGRIHFSWCALSHCPRKHGAADYRNDGY